jgi:hypothetical protein
MRDSKPKAGWGYPVLTGVAILYVCLLTFSIQFESVEQSNTRPDYVSGARGAVKPGLDESWAWGLNAAPHSGYIFGKDVVFTYGPLGFLMSPRPLGRNFEWAACFGVCIRAVFAALLAAMASAARSRRGFLLFLAGCGVSAAIGLWDEYLYRLVIGLCCVAACLTVPFAIAACVLAGVLMPLLLMIKFSIGLTAISTMGAATLILLVRGSWRKIFALWVSAALSLMFWVFVVFGSAGYFIRWLALSWEIAKGYGEALSFPGPPAEALAGISLFAVLLLSAVLLKGTARIPSLLFAVPAAMALKHGFVGYTGMSTGYFTFMVAVASVVFLFVETRAEWRVANLLAVLTLAVAIYKGLFLVAWPPITLDNLKGQLSGQVGMQALRNEWNWKALTLELQAESRRRLAPESLPARWKAGLRASEGGVDVYPWELTYIPANDLVWRPSLVLQHYQTDTHSLDQTMADRLGSQSGPSALLMEFTGLSGRHMLLDTPAVFRQVLSGYELVETDYSRNLLWVRRRTNAPASAANARMMGSTRIRFGDWVTPPECSGKLFGQFFMRPNALGSARQLLWKTPAVYLRLEYENAETAEFRILPSTAPGGLLINYVPRTLQDLADLIEGHAFHKVRRFQFFGPGTSSYRQEFDVNWIADNSAFVDYSQAQRQSSPEVVSVVADSSSGQSRMFTLTARKEGGYRRLKFVKFIANDTNSFDGACYLRYEVDRRILWLMDGSDRASGAAMLGSQQVLENAKCSVNLTESWPEFRGDTVTLHLAVALKTDVHRTQRIFAEADDESGLASALKEFLPWLPSAGEVREDPWTFPPGPPTLSVERTKVKDRNQYILKIGATDLNGFEDVDTVEVMVNNAFDSRHSCLIRFDAGPKTVSLRNDAGSAYSAPVELGSSNQLSNSYCTIAAPDRPVVKGRYDVYFTVEFAPTQRTLDKENVVIFLAAVDREGLRQNWRAYAVLPK